MKHGLKLYLNTEVRDEDGNILDKRNMVSKSFVYNFLKFLRDIMIGKTVTTGTTGATTYWGTTTAFTIYDLNGNTQNVNCASGVMSTNTAISVRFLSVDAPAGDDSYGIVVGYGTTTPAPNDYNLNARFTHGSNINQLLYGSTSVEDVTIQAPTSRFRVIRTFTNNYSTTQTVNEIGIIARYTYQYVMGTIDSRFLIARDSVSPGIAIPSGATLTIRYIFSIVT